MTIRLSRRMVALVATGGAAVALTVAAPSAFADRVPVGAAGNTTIQFSNQVLKTLQSNGCGALSAVSTGGGAVVTTGKGKVNVTFPITGVVVNPDSAHLRIVHSGSGVDLSNSCYDIRLTNFYIQNFGEGDESEGLDVLAKVKNDDGTDRELLFTLDLSSANPTMNSGGNVKIRSMNVLLSSDGASQFNQLATGNTPDEAGNVAGPFTTGEQAGKARTSVRLQYGSA